MMAKIGRKEMPRCSRCGSPMFVYPVRIGTPRGMITYYMANSLCRPGLTDYTIGFMYNSLCNKSVLLMMLYNRVRKGNLLEIPE